MDERVNANVEKEQGQVETTEHDQVGASRFGLLEMTGALAWNVRGHYSKQPLGLANPFYDNLALSILRQIEEEGAQTFTGVLVKCPVSIANFI